MNVKKYRILNISMILLTILCLLCALLLENISLLFDSISVLSCVIFLSTYRKAWSEDD